MVEQEVATKGIRMSKGVEPVFIIKQKIVVLPRAKTIVVEGVPTFVKVRYNELKLNQ